MNDLIKAVLLGIVEGVTEFLPISSTGHLILVNQWISFSESLTNKFDVIIQLGAILSVVVYFRKRLIPVGTGMGWGAGNPALGLWKKTIFAVIPALILGALFDQKIEELLFNPTSVSIALIAGGVAIILLESRKKGDRILSIDALDYRTAILIGLIQCAAMIPGTSRSAATIIGAMLLGCSRQVAVEFSFFLAIPTMVAASAYSLLKLGSTLSFEDLRIVSVGFLVSFAVAWITVAGFMRFITTRDFKPFGWYRIAFGTLVLLYFASE